jgi:hypothetical protein
VVLIDSRTGITDIGDICTVLLPDVLVMLFVTNHQNIEGIKDVMARAVRARAKLPINRSKLLAVPVPARDERDREYQKSVEWQNIFAEQFGDFFSDWLPKEVRPVDALNKLFIPYVASWSFGEAIPVLESERERSDPTSIGAAYARLATLLANRLDWNAVDGKASASELTTTRIALSSTREAAREAEAARAKAEAARTKAEEAQREAEARLKNELQAAHAAAEAARIKVEEAQREAEARLKPMEQRKEPSFWRNRGLPVLALAVTSIALYFGYTYFFPSQETWIQRLDSPSPDVRTAAIFELAFDNSLAGRDLLAPKIAEMLKDSSVKVRQAAAATFGIYDINKQFSDALVVALKDADSTVRFHAVSQFGNREKTHVPNVAALLADESDLVRRSAIKALTEMGPEAVAPYASKIAALMSDPHQRVQEEAKKALGILGPAGAKYLSRKK